MFTRTPLPPIRFARAPRALRMSALFCAVTVAALAAQPLLPIATASAQDLGIAVGAQAPSAALETLDGKPVELSTYIAGKPTVLEFWATWCPNCKTLEPALKKAHETYGNRVQFLGIAVSLNQSVERVKAYQARYKLPLNMLYDRRGLVSEAFDAPATSYIVVINAAGRVVYTGVGGDQDLVAAIRKAL